MREAAADLDFEEAARLRDEIKRLRATELAVVDDPTAKRPGAESPRAGALPLPACGERVGVRGNLLHPPAAKAHAASSRPGMRVN